MNPSVRKAIAGIVEGDWTDIAYPAGARLKSQKPTTSTLAAPPTG